MPTLLCRCCTHVGYVMHAAVPYMCAACPGPTAEVGSQRLQHLTPLCCAVLRCAALRWMGEARFTLGGLREVLSTRTYAANVAYYPGTMPPEGTLLVRGQGSAEQHSAGRNQGSSAWHREGDARWCQGVKVLAAGWPLGCKRGTRGASDIHVCQYVRVRPCRCVGAFVRACARVSGWASGWVDRADA